MKSAPEAAAAHCSKLSGALVPCARKGIEKRGGTVERNNRMIKYAGSSATETKQCVAGNRKTIRRCIEGNGARRSRVTMRGCCKNGGEEAGEVLLMR